MRLFVLAFMFLSFSAFGQSTKDVKEKEKTQVVEAACGTCQFGLKGADCTLAVKIDNKAYPVEGSAIDDHGDAHAHDGLCQMIRKAEVKGKIVDGHFNASYFKLLAQKEDENK